MYQIISFNKFFVHLKYILEFFYNLYLSQEEWFPRYTRKTKLVVFPSRFVGSPTSKNNSSFNSFFYRTRCLFV